MVSKRAWRLYPATYRQREMRILAGWIRAGESGSLIGLAGAGKSNLLGFLCRQSKRIGHYLADNDLAADHQPEEVFKLALVHVDLNNLPGWGLTTLYRVLLRSLYETHEQLGAIETRLPQAVEKLYRKVEEKRDPFLSQSALREALFLFKDEGIRLVFVLDPFDSFCRAATGQILDNLRGLRDSFKTTLSYIIGLRYELAYLRDPLDLGELYEILDTHRCWLGPMTDDDACWVIEQVVTATGQLFDPQQIEKLIALSGGYPSLLRAASLWLVENWPGPDMNTWEEALLAVPSVRNRLQEIWHGLTGEEQAVLVALPGALALPAGQARQKNLKQLSTTYQQSLSHLQAKQFCRQTGEGEWRIFSPLFTRFITGLTGNGVGRIRYDAKLDRFFRGEMQLANLSEKDRRLLHHFLLYPQVKHSLDDLIEAAWEEDDSSGVSNQAVQQAIRHLRKRIEPDPARHSYLITEPKAGYRFFPEGMPQR